MPTWLANYILKIGSDGLLETIVKKSQVVHKSKEFKKRMIAEEK